MKLPREHGAWAMLYVPFVLGVGVAWRVNWPVLLLLLSSSSMFVSRESLVAWRRARARGRNNLEAGRMLLLYFALTVAFAAPLVLTFKRFWLIPIALIAFALLLSNSKQATQLEDRSISNELLVISGLTLTAPAAYYAARGSLSLTALWLWLLSVLYFASSVFYIKLRIYRLNPRRSSEQLAVWRSCGAYHLFLVIALLVLILTGSLNLFAFVAFVPALFRTFLGMFNTGRKVNLRRAGFLEIAYSLIFLVCVGLSLRTA